MEIKENEYIQKKQTKTSKLRLQIWAENNTDVQRNYKYIYNSKNSLIAK